MAVHGCRVSWNRGEAPFLDGKYSRAHEWRFDGGAVVQASASPHHVRVPFSDPAGVDPEEALVAALSGCHMLSLLHLAARRGFLVDAYEDRAEGHMGRNAAGREAVVRVVLRPAIAWAGERRPGAEEIAALHHDAHEICYIANSVSAEVVVEPEGGGGAGG